MAPNLLTRLFVVWKFSDETTQIIIRGWPFFPLQKDVWTLAWPLKRAICWSFLEDSFGEGRTLFVVVTEKVVEIVSLTWLFLCPERDGVSSISEDFSHVWLPPWERDAENSVIAWLMHFFLKILFKTELDEVLLGKNSSVLQSVFSNFWVSCCERTKCNLI